MNNNKIINDKNFSDNISNFNLCNNSFISNGTENREYLDKILFSQENGSKKANSSFQVNKNDYNVEKQLERKMLLNSNTVIKNQEIEESIKDRTFKQFVMMNNLQNSEEYEIFKDRFDKAKKRSQIIMGLMCFYSMFILNNVYENQINTYQNTTDLINNKLTKYSKINFKLHFIVMTPLIGLLYYSKIKGNKIQEEFNKVLKDKYYDEDMFNLNDFKITLR